MTIKIYAIGKIKDFYKSGVDEYVKRLSGYAKVQIIEVKDESISDIDIQKYQGGGIIEEIELPEKMDYEYFEKNIKEPFKTKNLMKLDKTKKNNEEYLHLSIIGLHQYYKENKSLPKINSLKDSEKVISITEKIFNDLKKQNYYWLKKINKIDKLYTERVSRWSQCQISPITSFLGGIVAQEALKFTGKFIPFNQWFWFDFFELIDKLP